MPPQFSGDAGMKVSVTKVSFKAITFSMRQSLKEDASKVPRNGCDARE